MKTSINFKSIKSDSEAHNFRKKSYDYIRKDLTKNNEYWMVDRIAIRKEKIEKYCKEKSNRKLQKNAIPIREAVVVIKEKTTMLELQNLAKKLENELKIRIFQIAIHKDEGHYDSTTNEWKSNYHAHLVADWQDLKTGKTLKHSRFDYCKMQDITAEVLQMERGISGGKARLEAIEFKISKKSEELIKLQDKIDIINKEINGKTINNLKVEKKDFLGFKHFDKEKTLENYEEAIKALSIQLNRKENQLKSRNDDIIKLKKNVSFMNKENSDLKYNNAKILTNNEFQIDKKKELLNSTYNLILNEAKYQLLLNPNKNRSDEENLITEIIGISNKILENNKLPESVIETLFLNQNVVDKIIQILKPSNSVNEENNQEQRRKKNYRR